jgi:hypothetical protein
MLTMLETNSTVKTSSLLPGLAVLASRGPPGHLAGASLPGVSWEWVEPREAASILGPMGDCREWVPPGEDPGYNNIGFGGYEGKWTGKDPTSFCISLLNPAQL